MELDNEAIEEFKKLYYQEYGVKLTNQQAVDYGTRLIQLVKAVYGDNLPKSGYSIDNRIKKGNNKNELGKGEVF